MTSAFAAFIAASVAVTGAAPITAVIFSVAATLVSFYKPAGKYAFSAIALLIGLSSVTLPLTVSAIIYACCIATALVVRKNYYYSFPLLLIITFTIAVFGMKGENPVSLPQLGLIFLLPCAAAVTPGNRIKGLCAALAVALPISFGGGGALAAGLLLPALIPVLLYGNIGIQSKQEA